MTRSRWLGVLLLLASCAGQTPTAVRGTSTGGGNSKAVVEQTEEAARLRVQRFIAEATGGQPEEIEVSFLADANVPATRVFGAIYTPAEGIPPGRPGLWWFGAVQGDRVVTDRDDAIALVLQSWGYGQERTVPAVQVARVIGFLEASREPTQPILQQGDTEWLPDAYKKHVFLPREGRTGLFSRSNTVEYWNRDGHGTWLTRLIVHKDGKIERTRTPVERFLD